MGVLFNKSTGSNWNIIFQVWFRMGCPTDKTWVLLKVKLYDITRNTKRYIRFDHDLQRLLPLTFHEPVNDVPGHFRCAAVQLKEPVVIWKCPWGANL